MSCARRVSVTNPAGTITVICGEEYSRLDFDVGQLFRGGLEAPGLGSTKLDEEDLPRGDGLALVRSFLVALGQADDHEHRWVKQPGGASMCADCGIDLDDEAIPEM